MILLKNKSKEWKMKELNNKNCFLTGAASGIGRSFALALAKEGINLFITDINMEGLVKVKEEVEALGVKVIAEKCDVSKFEDFDRCAKQFHSKLGDVDLLINNAGIARGVLLENINLDDWKKVIDVNLWSIIYSLKAFIPKMLERGSGHIVNVASAAGILGSPEPLSYMASKFGVVGISEGLYGQISRFGIKVSVIIPLYIKTNIFFSGEEAKYPKKLVDGIGEEKLQEISQSMLEEMYDKAKSPDSVVKKYIAQIKKDQLYIYDSKGLLSVLAMKGANPKQYEEFLVKLNRDFRTSREAHFSKFGINLDDYL